MCILGSSLSLKTTNNLISPSRFYKLIIISIVYVYIGTAIRLAKAGFAIYGIDYEGHGKTAGLDGYVQSFDDVVDDCTSHFVNISG